MRLFTLVVFYLFAGSLLCQRSNYIGLGMTYDLPAIYAPKYGRNQDVLKITKRPASGGTAYMVVNIYRAFIKTGVSFHKIDVEWIDLPANSPTKSSTADIIQYHIPVWLGYRVFFKKNNQLGFAGMVGIVNWQTGLYHVYYRNGDVLIGSSNVPYKHVWGGSLEFLHKFKNDWNLIVAANYKNIYQMNPNKYFQETDYFQVNNWYFGLSFGVQYQFSSHCPSSK
jgi:hypothetical protein